MRRRWAARGRGAALVAVAQALLCLPIAAAGASAAAPSPRERVLFDFAWRHSLLHGDPQQPSPTPPTIGPAPRCPPAVWPANATGLDCSGGVPFAQPGLTAQICAAACCNDDSCAHWQFTDGTNTTGFQPKCMHSASPADPEQCAADAQWVGGSRPARLAPPPPNAPPAPSPSDQPEQAATSFDDTNWTLLDVPHDMNVDQAPSLAACVYGCGGRSYLARHSGWYRKHFNIPAEWKGQHLSVVFEGVFRFAMIYLNGELLQNHTCGYTSFEVPISTSRALRYGNASSNVLAVYVDARSGSGWWYEVSQSTKSTTAATEQNQPAALSDCLDCLNA
jgi:hypothetical protein